eukprot:4239908-Prymnesium_polylepis.1
MKCSTEMQCGIVVSLSRVCGARAPSVWAGTSRHGGAGSAPADGPFVFLLSTRAGGLGLNLTAANT